MFETFPGHEQQIAPEQQRIHELIALIERSLESVERARETWIQDVQELEFQIPHDDDLVDTGELSAFDLLRHEMLARIYELSDIETELRRDREELQSLLN